MDIYVESFFNLCFGYQQNFVYTFRRLMPSISVFVTPSFPLQSWFHQHFVQLQNCQFKMNNTERFADLGKFKLIKLLMVVLFQTEADFQYCPGCLKKTLIAWKVVKIDSNIIITSHQAESLTHSVTFLHLVNLFDAYNLQLLLLRF